MPSRNANSPTSGKAAAGKGPTSKKPPKAPKPSPAPKAKPTPRPPARIRRLLRIIGLGFAAFAILWGLIFGAMVAVQMRHLPDALALDTHNPTRTAFMDYLGVSSNRKLKIVPYRQISPHLVHAIVVAEDAKFWQHAGLDWKEMYHAFERNIERGRFARGGSTLTQQLVKNLYLSPKKRISRKLAEMLLTKAVESRVKKERILELYLSVIEWGQGTWGCEQAARHYFNTSCKALNPEQAIRLASIVVNPGRYHPKKSTPYMIRRRAMIARRMKAAGWLTAGQYAALPFER